MEKMIRILYPTGAASHGIEAEAGKVVEVASEIADPLVQKGWAEWVEVERATAAPGEKREVRLGKHRRE